MRQILHPEAPGGKDRGNRHKIAGIAQPHPFPRLILPIASAIYIAIHTAPHHAVVLRDRQCYTHPRVPAHRGHPRSCQARDGRACLCRALKGAEGCHNAGGPRRRRYPADGRGR
jgi:hypothetical protein